MTTTSPSLNYLTRPLIMDPPLPPHPTTIANPPATTNSNADSTSSSPRSHQTDNWDDPLPQVPGAKLRLMCSFGGHIIPRPHDKTLSYVGGETRIVVVDRNSSFSDVHGRLSRSLLCGHKFTMKYQLPNEELDSLISVTTDEDFENMIEEYDRIMSAAPSKPARIRLFLFLAKPETTASMGALLDDAKSETWFIDALNNSDLLNRGVSDSAVMDNLLEFDGIVKNDSSTNLEGQSNARRGNNQAIKMADQEVHSPTQDSPMVETSSSFDSGLSSPSMENLPPIKVRVNENTQGLDEQFSQISVANSRDNVGRIISDDDRSGKSMPVALRKPPLPLQPIQRKLTDPYNLQSPDSKQTGSYNSQSPDSVASDNSFTSAASISKNSDYKDPSTVVNQDNRDFAHATDPRNNSNNPSSQLPVQQIQEQNPHQQQQQFIQGHVQYIQHTGTGLMQVPSYYPMYAATPTTQESFHQQIDQQYPVYLMPVNHAHQYSLPQSQKPLVADATVASSVRPPNQATIPETDADVLRAVQGPTPTYVQLPPNQFQQQCYGLSHVQQQTRTVPTETDAEVRGTVQAPIPAYVQVPPNQYQQQYYGISHVQPQTQTVPTDTDEEVRGTVQTPTPPYVQVPPNQFQQQYWDVSHVQPQTQTIPTETDAEVRGTVQAPTPTYVQVPLNQFQQHYYGVSHVQPQTQTTPIETDAELRGTVQAPTPTYVQVPPNQFHQQYYGVSHGHPHAQTITTGQTATANYSYSYTHPLHDQLNYVQHPPTTTIPSQYQSITPGTALLISQATSQLATDNASQQIQISQPQ